MANSIAVLESKRYLKPPVPLGQALGSVSVWNYEILSIYMKTFAVRATRE